MSHAESGEPVVVDERRPGDPARPVTISYIAETAGVSVPTVSKVLNGRSGVSADTRARVEALIDEYGYRKSSQQSRSATVGLVFDEPAGVWGVEIIRGVQRAATRSTCPAMAPSPPRQ